MKRTIRPGNSEDVSFVFATWLRSYRHDSPFTAIIPQEVFFQEHQKTLEQLFQRDTVRIGICCDKDDPNHIFGYIVYEPLVPAIVHFLYVKRALRREGVARELLDYAEIVHNLEGCYFTHYTNTVRELINGGKLRGRYNPYRLYRETEGT